MRTLDLHRGDQCRLPLSYMLFKWIASGDLWIAPISMYLSAVLQPTGETCYKRDGGQVCAVCAITRSLFRSPILRTLMTFFQY
ncbi:hypothetical protein BDQ12DRAFT_676452 [Crucibulum laeve]|uniref:Uncharacterized protein n=1 Tax=Crucibulum laeve TaxID=68775 RepID=A0A5C3MD41_9AGAR|nr:hypothetical protein BDQ12DRAFT_676452 [Crucibulum laeve]